MAGRRRPRRRRCFLACRRLYLRLPTQPFRPDPADSPSRHGKSGTWRNHSDWSVATETRGFHCPTNRSCAPCAFNDGYAFLLSESKRQLVIRERPNPQMSATMSIPYRAAGTAAKFDGAERFPAASSRVTRYSSAPSGAVASVKANVPGSSHPEMCCQFIPATGLRCTSERAFASSVVHVRVTLDGSDVRLATTTGAGGGVNAMPRPCRAIAESDRFPAVSTATTV